MLLSAQHQQISPQLEHALYYAGLGWSVVPSHRVIKAQNGATACTCTEGEACISKGKHPAVSWTKWQTDRASEAQIKQWFLGQYAQYGVGIITGAVSGIFVVDVDEGPGKPGADTINDLQMINGDLPPTVQARTGGGGRHFIFRHPGNGWIATAKNVFGPGIDVRGDGGFIVAAPSMHESGRMYLWDENFHPKTTAILDAPAWVLDLARSDAPPPPGKKSSPSGNGEIVRDAWGMVIDGRERHMIGIICGVIAEWCRKSKALPEPEVVFAEAWPTYERTTRARGASLEADGRGETLMRQRTAHMLRRAAAGKWRIEVEEPNAPPKGRPAILHLEEVERLPPPEFLIAGLFPEKGLIVPYGPPKGGKTFLILSAALHVASNRPWFGRAVRGGGVIYIAGEGLGGLPLRLKAMRAHYQISSNIPFWVIPRALNFTQPTVAEYLTKLVRDTAGDEPIAMVVVDTMARAMPGADENSAKEVGLVIAACDQVREELECAVVPIHHQGKDETRGLRGTSAIRGAVDASFRITKSGSRVVMRNEDQKDAETAPDLVFDMLEVPVGVGSRSSLVPVLQAGQDIPDMPDNRPTPSGLTGMAYDTLLDLLAGEEAGIMPPVAGIPPNTRGVKVETLRQHFYARTATRTQEARQKAFVRAVDALVKTRMAGVRDPWIWRI